MGNSDLRITPIGIGAWAIGGGGWNGSMGPQNDSDSIPAIHAALDYGLNWIDTAALYGLGHSEEMVARAISARMLSSSLLEVLCLSAPLFANNFVQVTLTSFHKLFPSS